MRKERFHIKSAVYLILLKGDEILLSRRKNTGWEDGNYTVPAGHIDEGENATNALIREAKEEIGVKIKKSDISFAHVMFRHTPQEYIDFFFICKKWIGEIRNKEPDICGELKWVSVENLPKNTIVHVKKALQHSRNRNYFSETE